MITNTCFGAGMGWLSSWKRTFCFRWQTELLKTTCLRTCKESLCQHVFLCNILIHWANILTTEIKSSVLYLEVDRFSSEIISSVSINSHTWCNVLEQDSEFPTYTLTLRVSTKILLQRNVLNVTQWWNSVTSPETSTPRDAALTWCLHRRARQPRRHFIRVEEKKQKGGESETLLTLMCSALDRKVSKQSPGAGAFWWTRLPARRLHVSQVNKTQRGEWGGRKPVGVRDGAARWMQTDGCVFTD